MVLGAVTCIVMCPLMSMVAILVGSALFGFVGLLVSVPVCAVLFALFKTLMERRLRARGLPTDSESYDTMLPPED